MQPLIKTLSILSLLVALLQAGCGNATLHQPEYQRIVERISGIVGQQLDLDVSEVDVDVPLKQKKAADELDVVEIIINVEEAFNIEITDDEVVSRDLSVKKLADIVSKKKSLE
jgi:acyl carrier protein